MTNEITTQTLTPQQRGWLKMATAKNALVEELVTLQLACQSILLKPAATITEKENQLAWYRTAHKKINETRLSSDFVQKLNYVQDELMKYEKEADPKSNAEYIAKSNELLELKQREQRKAQDTNEKNAEVSRYKAHIQNQIELIVSDFKQRAWNEIKVMYGQAVETGDRNVFYPLVDTIKAMQFAIPATFQRTRITDEEVKPIKALFHVPDVIKLRGDMIEEAGNIFANLESDIAANVKPDIDSTILELKAETSQNMLINELSASVAPEIAPEGKGLKETIEIEITETQDWCDAVIVAWMKNKDAAKFLKVKKWSALTLGQMATALSKLATEKGLAVMPGLTLKKVTSL